MLEPHKDLVTDLLTTLEDPNGMHSRFVSYMKEGQTEKIPIHNQQEAAKLLEIVSQYLCAKFVHFIFAGDFAERIGAVFLHVCQILPDELDPDEVLKKFLDLARALILKNHPDPDGVINGIATAAQSEYQSLVRALTPPPGILPPGVLTPGLLPSSV